MHILFWGGYLWLSVFVFSGRENFNLALKISLVQIIPQMIIAYVNMELLIPRFFIQKKYVHYIGYTILCFFVLYLFYEFVLPEIFRTILPPPPEESRPWLSEGNHGHSRSYAGRFRRMRIIYGFTQTLAIFFLSTAFKTSQIALKREKEAADLKSENLNSELKFLRSQINPHFLFNALNNIYALSVTRSEKTPETILTLSEMLRYIIYDCNADQVPLEKEMNYINNYVELQKLKDEEKLNIETNFSKANGKFLIAPMILLPFVENSFKHSEIEDVHNGWIKLGIETSGNRLIFTCDNSIPKKNYTKDKEGGVGLENVKRRLDLLYPKKHMLKIRETDSEFSVYLELN